MALILIVEDDIDTAIVVEKYLQADGHSTHILTTGNGVIAWVKEHQPALIMLDLMLPQIDGLSILRKLRTFTEVPVIITTARIMESDRIKGLDLGADDYVCKPYSAREIVARARALIRRSSSTEKRVEDRITIHPDTLKACYGKSCIELGLIEFKLLELFHRNPERIYSREQIINHIYKDSRNTSDRTVDSHIRNLRKKLKSLFDNTEIIQSVYGAGYRYSPLP